MTRKKDTSAKLSSDAGDGRPVTAPGEEPHKIKNKLYRKATTESWPDLKGVESFFIDRQLYTDGIVMVTELHRLRDGTFNQLTLLVAKTKDGWKALNEISDDEL